MSRCITSSQADMQTVQHFVLRDAYRACERRVLVPLDRIGAHKGDVTLLQSASG